MGRDRCQIAGVTAGSLMGPRPNEATTKAGPFGPVFLFLPCGQIKRSGCLAAGANLFCSSGPHYILGQSPKPTILIIRWRSTVLSGLILHLFTQRATVTYQVENCEAKMAESVEVENDKLPQARSPKYPYISLDLAIERVRAIHGQIREHAQPREVVAKAYGKPATSSATLQTFATLLQYGLLENVMSNGDRRLRVTGLAQDILHPHAPPEKVARAKREAALSPLVFKELWERFGDTRNLNESMPLYYLTSDRAAQHGTVFTDKAASEVLRVYQATLDYAGVSESDKVEDETEGREPSEPDVSKEPKRGGTNDSRGKPENPPGGHKYVMSDGERELQTGMLSKKGATFRVIVSGHVGQKEIERLIAKLELDKEMLADDDPSDPTAH